MGCPNHDTANLHTRIWISEGLTQAERDFKGWNSHAHRGFPGKFEFTNLRRDTLSRENLSRAQLLQKPAADLASEPSATRQLARMI